jgi:hypothetical protein
MPYAAQPSLKLPPLISQLNDKLAGLPSDTLTLILLAIAAGLVGLALYGPPLAKAAAIAWTLAP